MIRALIIDDERKQRTMLHKMVNSYCEDVEIIDEAEDVDSGRELILKQKPELVFLDINMPGGSGFDILEQLKDIFFKVIFITAHEHYALQAIKFSAMDFILKPVSPEDLINAVNKAKEEIKKETHLLQMNTFFHNMKKSRKEEKKMVLKSMDSIEIVHVNEIIRCEADISYTTFFLEDGNRITVSHTLKEYEDILLEYNFYRSHKSHLINLDKIKRYVKKDGGYIEMADKSIVPISRRKKDELLEILNRL